MRTPITNIQGYVETLLEVGLDDVPQAMRHLGVIKRNSDRLKAIVNDVLSLTQLERPQTLDASDRSPVIVEDLLSMIVDHFSQDAAAKAINVSTASPEGLRISANGQMLEQGIGNLVANAIRYSPSGSSVELAAHVEGEDVVFTVRDEGPGMPAEHLPRLFERFYRVDKARSRELGGTGLGLAIVKHIALVHGGTVDVTSEIDAGSTFTVRLPIGRP
ncbi:MAG: sensor histidine kinase [Planctomycetota bacterium]